MPVNIKAGQHTVYWGDSLLLGGAVHGVSYAQNSLDIWKGFATPGTEAKELFRPRGGLTIQAQPANDLSIAGQWFYNWQAIRVPESGSYLTVNDGLQFGADSTLFQPNPYVGLIPGAPAYLRLWNANTPPASRYSGSLGDWGMSARWSPQWLDGTLGFYYRNATDIAPQVVATVGFAALPRGDVQRDRRHRACPAACVVNRNATTAADLTQKGKLGTYSLAYGDNIHIAGAHAVEGAWRGLGRRRAVVSREHAAGQRPGDRAARGAGAEHSRRDRDHGAYRPTARRARWATRCTGSSTRSTSSRRRRCSTPRRWRAS